MLLIKSWRKLFHKTKPAYYRQAIFTLSIPNLKNGFPEMLEKAVIPPSNDGDSVVIGVVAEYNAVLPPQALMNTDKKENS